MKKIKLSPQAAFDDAGWQYARRHEVNVVFFSPNTGKIWQWLGDTRKEKIKDLKGYPHMADCEAIGTNEYYKLFHGYYYEGTR